MAKNEFLPFGTAVNANVLSNADYQALPARSSGFQSGVAKSRELNTAWRQSSVISSVVAQFIADNSGNDSLDNGDTATLLKNLRAALNKLFLQSSNNLSEIKDSGSAAISAAQANLGLASTVTSAAGSMQKAANGADIPDAAKFRAALALGTAAVKNIGTGTGQVPDMSAFEITGNAIAGYIKLPNSVRIQWLQTPGNVPAGGDGVGYWSYAFPTACLFAIAVPVSSTYNAVAGNVSAGNFSTTAVELHNWGTISAPARIIGIGL